MTDHCDRFAGPKDLLGFATVDDGGHGVTFLTPLPEEVVDLIHSSHHRIEVRVQFVAEPSRAT